MRLHTLRLTAVGPFAGEEVVDFDRLSAGGLFLFEGPTGVGKSTILDALTFALFGGLASESGDVGRMRSDFADPQTRPEVELEFSVRGRRYRVTRSPEHLRPKLRGQGVTREKSSVHLQRRDDGHWVSVSHAKDEVGTLVAELLGLSREQFRQVVLLPQGEFATFLRAGDDRRREVLATLFGSRFYGQVAEQLQAWATSVRSERTRAESELAARVAAAVEAAGLGPEECALVEVMPLPDRAAHLPALGVQLRDRAERAAHTLRTAQSEEAAARAGLDAAERHLALVRRRAGLAERLHLMLDQRGDHEARVSQLAAAVRAEPVRALLELAASGAERLAVAAEAAAVAGVSGIETVDEHDADEAERSARELRGEADGLAGLVATESDLAAAAGLLAAESAQVEALVRERDVLAGRVAELPEELRTARAELQRMRQAAAGSAAAELALARAGERQAAAERLLAVEVELAELRRSLRRVRTAAQAAAQELELVTEQRLVGLRGELAQQLVNGGPCLVCGSTQHPAPARAGVAAATGEAVQEAALRCDEERIRLSELELAQARLEAERALLAATAEGVSAQQWHEQALTARAAMSEAVQAEEGLPTVEARLSELEASGEALASRRVTLGEQVAAAERQLASNRERLEADRAAIEAARCEHPTVAARAEAARARAGGLERQARAIRSVAAARAEYELVSGQLRREAVDVGFSDIDDARASMLSRSERDELEQAIEQWSAELAATNAQLAEPELAAVATSDEHAVAAGLDAARTTLAEAVARCGQAQREATVAERTDERFASRLVEVTEAAERLAEVSARAEEVTTLDLYARGMAGSPRMTLVTYVLRHWFEKVVRAANLRLDAMSAGKYHLVRVDEGARKDARVGLGLSVLDRHTGRERSPNTLSGGETFYTSLALALGLADVVVAEAGGAQLDTLFIDEGFGTLDPDTLEEVMGVIDDLRGNGRVVGIVSHVPDLKERIAERLSVRRVRPDGPSTVHVLA